MKPGGLLDLSLEELVAWAQARGQKPFRGKQLFRQLHKRLSRTPDQMTDLSRELRELLAGEPIGALEVVDRQISVDGTRKLLLRARDGAMVESVLIPMETGHATQCISSQVGCAMGCTFCLTGTLGLTRNLTPGEIVDQHYLAQAESDQAVRNLVFMGMGEPLHNFDNVARAIEIMEDELGQDISPRRITVSTCGWVPGIRRMAETGLPALLAISLNATDDELRDRIMPVNRRWPLADLLNVCRSFPLAPRNRITFEYVLLAGLNDSPAHARQLVRLLTGIRAKVNLIPFNEVPELPYKRPSQEAVLAFQDVLVRKDMTATLRASKGQDILAACGQLVAESEQV